MNGRTILFLLLLMAPCRVFADAIPIPSVTANAVCRRAITAAERYHNIPSHLLAAIARVESGRRDPASGAFDPWPWTINMDGKGTFYDNKAEAVAAAVSMRSHIATSIDVGCMQISLTFHPDAFSDLDQAFDPGSNAEYAARFLVQLFEKTNSWPKAVEMYHSATLDLGEEYGHRVYAAWPEEQRLADLNQPIPVAPVASAWAPPIGRSMLSMPLRPGAPHIIPLMSGLGGGAPPGRSLASYRLTPVQLAFRTP